MAKNVYIVADLHLGIPNPSSSLLREKKFIQFLEEVRHNLGELVLLGDLFDFWFEYQTVVPKGYFRLFAKLAELREQNISITLFSGNHDLWLKNYFPEFLDIPVIHEPKVFEWFGKKFFLAHGDGLGPKDYGFKIMKKAFQNSFLQWCFRWLHPDIGIGIANYFSRKSRYSHQINNSIYHGEEEWITRYFYKKSNENPDIQYFIFGHRHLPIEKKNQNEQTMLVLGDWISQFSYLTISENGVNLCFFENEMEIQR